MPKSSQEHRKAIGRFNEKKSLKSALPSKKSVSEEPVFVAEKLFELPSPDFASDTDQSPETYFARRSSVKRSSKSLSSQIILVAFLAFAAVARSEQVLSKTKNDLKRKGLVDVGDKVAPIRNLQQFEEKSKSKELEEITFADDHFKEMSSVKMGDYHVSKDGGIFAKIYDKMLRNFGLNQDLPEIELIKSRFKVNSEYGEGFKYEVTAIGHKRRAISQGYVPIKNLFSDGAKKEIERLEKEIDEFEFTFKNQEEYDEKLSELFDLEYKLSEISYFSSINFLKEKYPQCKIPILKSFLHGLSDIINSENIFVNKKGDILFPDTDGVSFPHLLGQDDLEKFGVTSEDIIELKKYVQSDDFRVDKANILKKIEKYAISDAQKRFLHGFKSRYSEIESFLQNYESSMGLPDFKYSDFTINRISADENQVSISFGSDAGGYVEPISDTIIPSFLGSSSKKISSSKDRINSAVKAEKASSLQGFKREHQEL